MNLNHQNSVVTALIRILDGENSAHRCHAAQALGRIGARAATSALVARLRDEDIDVCIDASTALGRIADPDAVDGLLTSFTGDPSGEVRAAIAEAFKTIASPAAADALLSAIRERDPVIELEEGWDHWWDVQRKSIEALAAIGESSAVSALVAALDDPDNQDLTETALPALGALGDDGVKALIRFLDAPTPLVRRRALQSLLESPDAGHIPEAAVRIDAVMAGSDPDMRETALDLLESWTTNINLDLSTLSRDPDANVRLASVRAMGRNGLDKHLSRLFAMVQDRDVQVRRKVLEILSQRRSEHAIPWFLSALNDPDPAVGAAAATGLGRLGAKEALEPLIELLLTTERNQELRATAARAIASLPGDESVQNKILAALKTGVKDHNRLVRMAAITALSALKNPHAIDTLIAALRGELLAPPDKETADATSPAIHPNDEPVKAEASETGPKSTLEAMELDNRPFLDLTDGTLSNEKPDASEGPDGEFSQIVQDHFEVGERLLRRREITPYQDIRLFAARSLGSAVPSCAVQDALLETLADPDAALRTEALRSLGLLGMTHTATALLPHLDAASAEEADAAAQALGQLNDPVAIPMLLERLETAPTKMRVGLARALCAFIQDDRVKARLISLLGDPAPTLRLTVAESLVAASSKDAFQGIAAMAWLDEGSQRQDVGRLLARLDPKAGVEYYLERLDAPNLIEQRRVAIDVLAELLVADRNRESPHIHKSQEF